MRKDKKTDALTEFVKKRMEEGVYIHEKIVINFFRHGTVKKTIPINTFSQIHKQSDKFELFSSSIINYTIQENASNATKITIC